jgi:DNA uptake protein ComE-like DNA-binding protein
MSETPTKPPDAGTPTPPLPDILAAWPRTAQGALAFLLVVNTLLITVYCIGSMRTAARPTELEQAAAQPARLDLNSADHAQLRQLPEVGDKLAGRIEEYRRTNGGFRSVEELQNVQGIGPARMYALRELVTVSSEGVTEATPAKPVLVRRVSYKKPASATKKRRKKGEGLTSPIDINSATEQELRQLPGIGATLAPRIIEARPFHSVDDLKRVRGIKDKKLNELRPYIIVGSKSKRAI